MGSGLHHCPSLDLNRAQPLAGAYRQVPPLGGLDSPLASGQASAEAKDARHGVTAWGQVSTLAIPLPPRVARIQIEHMWVQAYVNWAPGRGRALCPWPQVARYNGSRSLDDPASFSCAKS